MTLFYIIAISCRVEKKKKQNYICGVKKEYILCLLLVFAFIFPFLIVICIGKRHQ